METLQTPQLADHALQPYQITFLRNLLGIRRAPFFNVSMIYRIIDQFVNISEKLT